MSRLLRNISRKLGMPPGSPVYTGRKKTASLQLSILDYTPDHLEETQTGDIEAAFPFRDAATTTWVTVTGLHETEKIAKLTNHYGIHPLICEDILNIHQRPKIEIFDDYLFVTLKTLEYDAQSKHLSIDQVSLILGRNYVLCFQESQEPLFEPLKIRIREQKGRIRSRDADYLLYSILDIIVDQYFLNLEKISDHIEQIEEQLMDDPTQHTLNQIYHIKREVLYLRKSIWPLRETVSKLDKSESPLIRDNTAPYLRDLYDHTIQVIDGVETNRDLLSGMLDLYLSSASNKMNQVMKMLTIIATIFIPLTFVVGIYGMNFEHMPELEWRYAYFVILGIMFTIAVGMLLWFRRKGWL